MQKDWSHLQQLSVGTNSNRTVSVAINRSLFELSYRTALNPDSDGNHYNQELPYEEDKVIKFKDQNNNQVSLIMLVLFVAKYRALR